MDENATSQHTEHAALSASTRPASSRPSSKKATASFKGHILAHSKAQRVEAAAKKKKKAAKAANNQKKSGNAKGGKGYVLGGGEGMSTQKNKNASLSRDGVGRGICIDVKSGGGNDINEICKMVTNEEVIEQDFMRIGKDMLAEGMINSVKKLGETEFLNKLVADAEKVTKGYGRCSSVQGLRCVFDYNPTGVDVPVSAGGGHVLGSKGNVEHRGELYDQQREKHLKHLRDNGLTALVITATYRELPDGGKTHAETVQVMTQERILSTIVTMGKLCRTMLRPETFAMMPDLFWSFVFWFADKEKGVVKISQMFQKALPSMDWDFLKFNSRECKEEARVKQETAKAEKKEKRAQRLEAKKRKLAKAEKKEKRAQQIEAKKRKSA